MKHRWWITAIQIVIWCAGVPPLLLLMIIHVQWPIVSSAAVLIAILMIGYLLNFKPGTNAVSGIGRFLVYMVCMTAVAGGSCFLVFWGIVIYSWVVLRNPF